MMADSSCDPPRAQQTFAPFFSDEQTEVKLDIDVQPPVHAAPPVTAAPPALPVPLVRVRRASDAWLQELPPESREVLERARAGRPGRAGRPVTRAMADRNKAIPSLRR